MLDSPNPTRSVRTLSTPADGSLHVFFEACVSGDLELVTELVQGRNRPEDYLYRGLLAAAEADQAVIAGYLLEQGASLEPSPVAIMAARGRSLSVFQVLKEHGWNVETEGYKVLPYVPCIMCYPFDIFTQMLPLLNKHIEICCEIELTYARSVVRSEPLVRWLLENGADPTRGEPRWNEDIPGDDRNAGAALNAAANACEITVFDLLLKRGARIETSVPLHMAAKNPARGAKCILMMTHLLELGLDVDGLDDIQGPYRLGTPLYHAVRNRAVEAAQFLLEQGADPYKKNQWGYAPAEEAIKKNDTVFIKMFEAVHSPKGVV